MPDIFASLLTTYLKASICLDVIVFTAAVAPPRCCDGIFSAIFVWVAGRLGAEEDGDGDRPPFFRRLMANLGKGAASATMEHSCHDTANIARDTSKMSRARIVLENMPFIVPKVVLIFD